MRVLVVSTVFLFRAVTHDFCFVQQETKYPERYVILFLELYMRCFLYLLTCHAEDSKKGKPNK
jgi:hypothetical protein